MVRRGGVVAAYTSADGINWTWAGSASIAFPDTAQVGLAVCSHDNSKTDEVIFDNVSLEPPPPVEKAAAAKGAGTGLLGSYFDATTGKLVCRLDPDGEF